jgi:hypothetical protein
MSKSDQTEFQWREVICYCFFTLEQHSSRRNSAERRLPSMHGFWLGPIMGLCRTTGAARATTRSSAWFHPNPLPGLADPVAASVVTPAIQGNCCRGRGGSVRKAGERSTKGECGSIGRYTACSKASRPYSAGCGMHSNLSIFPYLRSGGNECRWARFEGDFLVQTIAQKTVWARKNSSKMARFGHDSDPCPTLDLGKGPMENILSFPN